MLQENGILLSLVMMLNGVQLSAAIIAGVLCQRNLPGFPFSMDDLSDAIDSCRASGVAFCPARGAGGDLSTPRRADVVRAGDRQTAGWYAAASRVIEPVKMLHFAVLGALLPALAHLTTPTADRQQSVWLCDDLPAIMLFLLAFSVLVACASSCWQSRW